MCNALLTPSKSSLSNPLFILNNARIFGSIPMGSWERRRKKTNIGDLIVGSNVCTVVRDDVVAVVETNRVYDCILGYFLKPTNVLDQV